MRKLLPFLTVFLLVALSAGTHSQALAAKIGWVSYNSSNDGLAEGVVVAIDVSKDGTIWTGSLSGGITRFDGNIFTSYREENGLPSNIITDVFSSDDEKIWASTGKGITSFNGSSWTNSAVGIYCYTVSIDNNNQAWLGYSNGAGKYSKGDWYVVPGIMGTPVRTIVPDNQGNIWFGTSSGLTLYGSSNKYYTQFGGTLNIINSQGFNTYQTLAGPISSDIYKLFLDTYGILWIGTDKGLSKYNGSVWTHYNTSTGLSSNVVNAIAEDKTGNIWIGYSYIFNPNAVGTSRFDGNNWTHFTTNEGLSGNIVYDIAVAPNGNVWFATNGGISMYGLLPPAPEIALSLTEIDFGTTIAGAALDSGFVIYNNGDSTLRIDSVTSNSTAFTILTPLTNIEAGDSLTIKVRFTPSEYGAFTGLLKIASNDKNEPVKSINLKGQNITPPQIKLSMDTVNYGKTRVGSTSNVFVKISNKGQATLEISSELNSQVFSLSSKKIILGDGKSDSLRVSFSPKNTASYSDVLILSSNDPAAPRKSIILIGEGISSNLHISQEDLIINFPNTYIDSTQIGIIKLSNTGSAVLYIDKIYVGVPSVFGVEGTKDSIPGNNYILLSILFRPKAVKEYLDTLWINTKDTTAVVVLYGRGIELPFFNSSSGNVIYRANTSNLTIWFKANYHISDAKVSAHYSLDDGKTFLNPLDCAYEDGRFIARMPEQNEGAVVHYYFEIDDPVLGKKVLPPSAPQELYSLRVAYDADVNGDNKTDVFDLLFLLKNLSSGAVFLDVNKDGCFDIFDLLDLLKALKALSAY